MHKILVFSDSHGSDRRMEHVLLKEKDWDTVIHLGDLEETEEDFRRLIDRVKPLAACITVRGNCDYDVSLHAMRTVSFYGLNFLLCHGHLCRVNNGFTLLSATARENGCDFALFGHTHVPAHTAENGVELMNPGSISLPRQQNGKCSYGILTVTEKKEVTFEIRYADETE